MVQTRNPPRPYMTQWPCRLWEINKNTFLCSRFAPATLHNSTHSSLSSRHHSRPQIFDPPGSTRGYVRKCGRLAIWVFVRHHKPPPNTHKHTLQFPKTTFLSFLPDASINLAHFHYILILKDTFTVSFHAWKHPVPCFLLYNNCTLLLLFILSWVFVHPPLLLFFLFSFSFLFSFALPPCSSFYRKFSPICCTSKPFMFCSVSSEHVKEPQLLLLWENHSQSFPNRLDVQAFFEISILPFPIYSILLFSNSFSHSLGLS